jgi:hypothetical protein
MQEQEQDRAQIVDRLYSRFRDRYSVEKSAKLAEVVEREYLAEKQRKKIQKVEQIATKYISRGDNFERTFSNFEKYGKDNMNDPLFCEAMSEFDKKRHKYYEKWLKLVRTKLRQLISERKKLLDEFMVSNEVKMKPLITKAAFLKAISYTLPPAEVDAFLTQEFDIDFNEYEMLSG